MIALSTASARRLCVCVRACVVEQASLCCPRLLMRTAAVQTWAPGSQPDSGRMQEVSWMKYDLNAHPEMGNITLEAYSICLHALKIQGFITHWLWCIWENFNVYRRGPSRRRDVCINITQPRCCFSLWTQHAELITVASFVCLGCFLGQQTANELCQDCYVGFCPILKTGENQCFNNRPVAKWVVSLKVAAKISFMGITSCIFQSVISPITAALGGLTLSTHHWYSTSDEKTEVTQ